MTDSSFKNNDVTGVSVVTPKHTHMHVYTYGDSLSYIYSYDSDISDKRDKLDFSWVFSVTPLSRDA